MKRKTKTTITKKTKKSRAIARGAVLFGVSLTAAVCGAAQDSGRNNKATAKPYAVIFGTVFDANQKSIYGVKVNIRRSDQKKAKFELYSDHAGEFAQRVPPGPADYIVWADVKVPKGQQKPERTVHIDGDEETTVYLSLGGAADASPAGKKGAQ
jgi:hypothetical protein